MGIFSTLLGGPALNFVNWLTEDENGDGVVENASKTVLMAVGGLALASVGTYIFVNFAQSQNVGALVLGTTAGAGLMVGGGIMAYSRIKAAYFPTAPPSKDVLAAVVGPFMMFEGAILIGQGAGFNNALTALGLVQTQNYWVTLLGGMIFVFGALDTLNTVNQIYRFLPYGWNYSAGIWIALLGSVAMLAVSSAYRLSITLGEDVFDWVIFLASVGGCAAIVVKIRHEWYRYSGKVFCPEDKKYHYVGGDWTNVDVYDSSIIKSNCGAQGAGQSDRDYQQEYFDRMAALKAANKKNLNILKNKYENPSGYLKDCSGRTLTMQDALSGYEPDLSCYPNYTKTDSPVATDLQNTTGSGLNPGKKGRKGK